MKALYPKNPTGGIGSFLRMPLKVKGRNSRKTTPILSAKIDRGICPDVDKSVDPIEFL
jgi:hypothetical protein